MRHVRRCRLGRIRHRQRRHRRRRRLDRLGIARSVSERHLQPDHLAQIVISQRERRPGRARDLVVAAQPPLIGRIQRIHIQLAGVVFGQPVAVAQPRQIRRQRGAPRHIARDRQSAGVVAVAERAHLVDRRRALGGEHGGPVRPQPCQPCGGGSQREASPLDLFQRVEVVGLHQAVAVHDPKRGPVRPHPPHHSARLARLEAAAGVMSAEIAACEVKRHDLANCPVGDPQMGPVSPKVSREGHLPRRPGVIGVVEAKALAVDEGCVGDVECVDIALDAAISISGEPHHVVMHRDRRRAGCGAREGDVLVRVPNAGLHSVSVGIID